MILLLSSSREISPSPEQGFGSIILDRVVCCLSNGLLKEFLGRFTKAVICRVAAYLNNAIQRIANKDGSR
jgi:hypothetical protein